MARILHFITSLDIGGAEKMLLKLATDKSSPDYHEVFCLGKIAPIGKELNNAGISVKYFNLSATKPFSLMLFYCLYRMWSQKFDVFQGWMYHANVLAFIFAKFQICPKPVIFGIRQTLYSIDHEKWLTKKFINLNRFLSSRADVIVYNSSVSKVQHENFGFSSKNSQTIANGFDVSAVSDREIAMMGKVERQNLTLSTDDFIFGMFCRNHPSKGLDVFVQAALEVRTKHTNVFFVLYGKGMDSRSAPFNRFKIQSGFIFPGVTLEVHQKMSAIDALVSSSIWGEAFSNSICEAMLLGKPVIVTDIGASKFLAKGAGITIKPGDKNELVSAMEALLCLPVKDKLKLGLKGRDKIKKNYSIEKTTLEFSRLYSALVR